LHPAFPETGEFHVEELTMTPGDDDREATLDLLLRRGEFEEIRLRFFSPQRVDIAPEFEPRIGDFAVFDVSERGMDEIGVWVIDRASGAIEFFARDVAVL
jgi:hypothetical protein